MGYTNFEENLRRIRKFDNDYIFNVVDDYSKNPEQPQHHVQKPQTPQKFKL